MIVLLDEQATLLLRLMNAVVQGESYSIREVREAIDFLANATSLQCPFEQQFRSQLGTALAKEIVAALTHRIQECS